MRHPDAGSYEDDRLMAQENKQLAQGLLQSQASMLASCLAFRRVVSVGVSPGYVRDWTAADGFRELYQN